MKNQKNIMKNLKFMNSVIFAINLQILGIMEQTNQFVKIVQKNIKYLNCKNHHQIMNRSRFPLVYNGFGLGEVPLLET